MKLLREHRLIDVNGITVLVLSSELFPAHSVSSFYFTYNENLKHRGPLKIVAVDSLGERHEINPENL